MLCRLTDDDVTEDDITVTSQVDEARPLDLPVYGEPEDVRDRGAGERPGRPADADRDPGRHGTDRGDARRRAVELELAVTGTRTQESGTPSLLDATGAQLWLAPILLVAAAVVALLVRARRGARAPGRGDTRS